MALEQAEYNLATIYSSHNTTPVQKIECNNETRKKLEQNFERDERKLVKCMGCGNNGHEIENC